MQYEVFPIKTGDPEAVAENIAAAYTNVAQRCGKVVAGHVFTCVGQPDHQDDVGRLGASYLFIVAALPERYPSPRERVAIGSEGGKASKR